MKKTRKMRVKKSPPFTHAQIQLQTTQASLSFAPLSPSNNQEKIFQTQNPKLQYKRDMQSESGGEGSQQIQSVADNRGRHRVLAELKRQEQETRFLEEELEQIEKTEKSSAVCKEMLIIVETKPDPLLPLTNGPTNPYWDRWFEGPQDSQGCKCWIL